MLIPEVLSRFTSNFCFTTSNCGASIKIYITRRIKFYVIYSVVGRKTGNDEAG
jgi:hypothetical protein